MSLSKSITAGVGPLAGAILAAAGRRYPFYRGFYAIANCRFLTWFSGRFLPSPTWSTLRNRLKIRISPHEYVGRTIYCFGDLDRKITWVCEKVLRAGDTVLDIGANVGVVSLFCSPLVGTGGRVHAFEPNPEPFGLFQESIGRNAVDNIVLHNVALGERDEDASLMVEGYNMGAASLVRKADDVRTVTVSVRNGSDYLSGLKIGPVRLVKLDVEGFEEQVLLGGFRYLSENRPDAVLFESNGQDDGRVYDLLGRLNFRLFEIPRSLFQPRLRPFNPSTGKSHSNDLLALNNESLAKGSFRSLGV